MLNRCSVRAGHECPCECGAIKYKKGNENYEIDKFDEVVQQMSGGVVVSLDPKLDTLKPEACKEPIFPNGC